MLEGILEVQGYLLQHRMFEVNLSMMRTWNFLNPHLQQQQHQQQEQHQNSKLSQKWQTIGVPAYFTSAYYYHNP